MPIYVFVCDSCGAEKELLRTLADRTNPVRCWGGGRDGLGVGHVGEGPLMRQKVTVPTVHYKGHGWTRTPAIMRESIAEGHPGRRENWGTGSAADYGDPDALTPYQHVIADDGTDLGSATVGADGKSVVEAGSTADDA